MAKSPHLTRNEFVTTMVAVLGTVMGVVVGLPAIGYLVGPFLKVIKDMEHPDQKGARATSWV